MCESQKVYTHYAVRWERRVKAGMKALEPAREGAKQNSRGKEGTYTLPMQSFMQSHSKENGKYVMICNDITCP